DGIRDSSVSGVQTCALPICSAARVRYRLVEQYEGDRCDDDQELREDPQFQLFYFYHSDRAQRALAAAPGPRDPHDDFYAVSSGPSILGRPAGRQGWMAPAFLDRKHPFGG